MLPEDSELEPTKADLDAVEPRLLKLCYEAHLDGRALPGYVEVGAMAGKGEKFGRAMYRQLVERGLLTGVAGRKPTGVTEAGRLAAEAGGASLPAAQPAKRAAPRGLKAPQR